DHSHVDQDTQNRVLKMDIVEDTTQHSTRQNSTRGLTTTPLKVVDCIIYRGRGQETDNLSPEDDVPPAFSEQTSPEIEIFGDSPDLPTSNNKYPTLLDLSESSISVEEDHDMASPEQVVKKGNNCSKIRGGEENKDLRFTSVMTSTTTKEKTTPEPDEAQAQVPPAKKVHSFNEAPVANNKVSARPQSSHVECRDFLNVKRTRFETRPASAYASRGVKTTPRGLERFGVSSSRNHNNYAGVYNNFGAGGVAVASIRKGRALFTGGGMIIAGASAGASDRGNDVVPAAGDAFIDRPFLGPNSVLCVSSNATTVTSSGAPLSSRQTSKRFVAGGRGGGLFGRGGGGGNAGVTRSTKIRSDHVEIRARSGGAAETTRTSEDFWQNAGAGAAPCSEDLIVGDHLDSKSIRLTPRQRLSGGGRESKGGEVGANVLLGGVSGINEYESGDVIVAVVNGNANRQEQEQPLQRPDSPFTNARISALFMKEDSNNKNVCVMDTNFAMMPDDDRPAQVPVLRREGSEASKETTLIKNEPNAHDFPSSYTTASKERPKSKEKSLLDYVM
ncbi:unnamed protein product, partial [Amoebophrya sp. A25]